MAFLDASIASGKRHHGSTTYPRAVFLEARKLRRPAGSACPTTAIRRKKDHRKPYFSAWLDELQFHTSTPED
jgi:hypothetical protein